MACLGNSEVEAHVACKNLPFLLLVCLFTSHFFHLLFGASVIHLKASIGNVVQNLSNPPIYSYPTPTWGFLVPLSCQGPWWSVSFQRTKSEKLGHAIQWCLVLFPEFICRVLQSCQRWNRYLSPGVCSEGMWRAGDR
jgi:hypothetical protein